MVLTQDELYDLYDGSWEQKFVTKLDKDIFDIRGKTPEEALKVLTKEKIEEEAKQISEKIAKMDNGDLGIRQEVLDLGLTDRYLGLRNKLETLSGSTENVTNEFVSRLFSVAPKEILLLVFNAHQEGKLTEYVRGLSQALVETEDKMDMETVYFINNMLLTEDDVESFYHSLVEVIHRLEMLSGFVYEERYYNPTNLYQAIQETIMEDVNWKNVSDFPVAEFLNTDTSTELYEEYLNIIKPVKETKALSKLSDELLGSIKDGSNDSMVEKTYDEGRYIYSNGIAVLLRDGLTVIEPNGEFKQIPSSKATKAVKEDLISRLT